MVVVLLERRNDAKRIYARVLNSKSGSDGFKEEGITFPSESSQRALTQETYDEIGLDPADIGYVEAHVTGTAAGDPVEMNAVYQVICTKRKEPLLIGCVKSSVGHAEGGSGLCSVAKACLVLQTKLIPPNLHYKNPNPNIKGLMDGKMKAVTEVTPLPGKIIPINSFGFGGANTHVVIEGFYSEDNDSINAKYANNGGIPRLINVPGRLSESINHIFHRIETNSKYQSNDFLSLLNDFAKNDEDASKFPYRAFMIISEDDMSGKKGAQNFEKSYPTLAQFPSTWLVFRESAQLGGSFNSLLEIQVFQASLKTVASESDIKRMASTETMTQREQTMKTLLSQLAWIETFKSLNFKPDGVLGYGIGTLSAACFEGQIDFKEAIQCALVTDKQLSIDRLKSEYVNILGEKRGNFCLKLSSKILSGDEGLNGTPASALAIEAGPEGIYERGSKNPLELSPLLRSIKTLGTLYTNGHTLNIECLYEPVTYPLPSTTPTLSSLIKWDHRKTYCLKPYLVQDTFFQKNKKIQFHCDKRSVDDAFFYDHRIDDRILFPAAGYLMLVWSAYAKFLNCSPWDIPVQFSNVSFKRATVLNKSSETALSTLINEGTGNFVVCEGDSPVVSGNIRTLLDTNDDLFPEKWTQDTAILDAKNIYKEFRVRGYDYGPYFQCLMEASSNGREAKLIWRDVVPKAVKEALNLESDEEQSMLWVRSWVTFVDAMFQLDILREENDSRSLFVPTWIDSLSCDPQKLFDSIQRAPKFMDALTLDESSLIPTYGRKEHIIWTEGIQIKGLKTTLLKRKQQMVTQMKHIFIPFRMDDGLDDGNHLTNGHHDLETDYGG